MPQATQMEAPEAGSASMLEPPHWLQTVMVLAPLPRASRRADVGRSAARWRPLGGALVSAGHRRTVQRAVRPVLAPMEWQTLAELWQTSGRPMAEVGDNGRMAIEQRQTDGRSG